MAHPTPELPDCEAARRAWSQVIADWSATIERAQALPEHALHRRVNGEWSLVETLRHLVFVTDVWVRRPILADPQPYHPLGLPPHFVVDVSSFGIDVDAEPSFADVYAARRDRTATVQRVVDELTPEGFERACDQNAFPGSTVQSVTVGHCLAVLMHEERAHHSFAVRDLAVLEAG